MAEVKASRMNAKVAYELEVGKHHIMSDAPPESGGEDLGPQPHDLLSAALAACTAITLQMYANHKGWPLTSSNVAVTGEKIGGAHVFRVKLRFNGDLSEEQKQRLAQIAGQCPVHKTLSGTIRIESEITP